MLSLFDMNEILHLLDLVGSPKHVCFSLLRSLPVVEADAFRGLAASPPRDRLARLSADF